MCSGVSGTIWGAGGNGGGIDELILLLMLRGAGELLLEELRFLGFGDSCGTLLRLRFVVVVVFVLIVVLALLAVDWAGALIMVGSGARGR